MQRTKLSDRKLPNYTKGEEIFNMVSHIVGGGFGVIALIACVITSVLYGDAWGVVSSSIYGISLIALYTMSSIYHGLRPSTAKKVLQIIDHCTIYFLIGGSYTPVTLCAIREVDPGVGWLLFGVVWGLAALAITLTAIDLKKYSVFSMICYIGMGWCIVFAANYFLQAVEMAGVILLLAGGIAYTVGAILYGLGKKHKYVHSVFHLFVLLGSILQFLSIWLYVI